MALKLPAALLDRANAAGLLPRYWATHPDGSPVYSGSRFERLGGGGGRRVAENRFTAEDFVAVAMLSVSVRAHAVLRVLEPTEPSPYNRLLHEIPADLDLVDAGPEHIAQDSPAWELWTRLQEIRGIGPVGAGKLLARKRPRLLPVYDSVTKKVFQRPVRDLAFWSDVRTELRRDQRSLVAHFEAVRETAELGKDISVLRILDTTAWLHGTDVMGNQSGRSS